MSRWGKILFFVGWLALAILFGVRYLLGGWMNGLYIPLGIGLAAFAGAIVLDFRFYLEFFTMRTTKHGMNMGSMILLALAGLVAINFVAVRKNKVWDVTEDKLYSLSQQSVDVLKPLSTPLSFTIFYRGESARDALNAIRETLRPYQETSKDVEVVFYDTYVENAKAQAYLNSLPDKDSANNKLFVFAEYQGKRERVTAPFSESELTAAIVKATRKTTNKIYFLTGHGERDLTSEGEEGIKGLEAQLEQNASNSVALNLLSGAEIPKDASVVIIVGPKQPLLPAELVTLKNYLIAGGRLVVMADPGEKHAINGLLEMMGVELGQGYLVNGGLQVQGMSQVTVVGIDFDQASDITKPIVSGNTFALFHLAAEVHKSPKAPAEFKIQELVRTSPRSFTISELSDSAKRSEMKTFALAISVKGKMPTDDGKASEKEFAAVIFGDSDFASNKFLSLPTNLNLLLNSVASLTGQADLISIRPKTPKSTPLTLDSAKWLGVVVAGVSLPIGLIILGSLVWFRRRSA